jgi:hypothetical protein
VALSLSKQETQTTPPPRWEWSLPYVRLPPSCTVGNQPRNLKASDCLKNSRKKGGVLGSRFKERSSCKHPFRSGVFLEKHILRLRNFLRFSTFNKKLNLILVCNSYFFNSNKRPIDKADKDHHASYLIGSGFLFMFYDYAYPAPANFTLFTYNWFTFNFQLTSLLFLVVNLLTFGHRAPLYLIFFCSAVFFFFTRSLTKLFVPQPVLVVSTPFFSRPKRFLTFLQLSALPTPL